MKGFAGSGMDCPDCKRGLLVLELNRVEIDYCSSCGGIWLDSGELELLLGESPYDKDLLSSFAEIPASRERKIRCPVCSKKMLKITGTGDHPVTLDKCKNNHGFWLNKGELESVLNTGGVDKVVVEHLRETFGRAGG